MKVLIVDDSNTMRMLVRKAITKALDQKLDFQEAGNGVEALKIVEEWHPDLMLTDWNMPEMTGIELLQQIKEKDLKLVIGMITSQKTKEHEKQAEEAGAAFLLPKPFTPALVANSLANKLKHLV